MLLATSSTNIWNAYSALDRSTFRVLGVGAIGGYYVALCQQQQYQVLLLGAVALAILAWLGSGADLLGLLRELYRDRKEAEEKRKQKLRKHTKILNEQVYKKLLHIFFRGESISKRRKCMIPFRRRVSQTSCRSNDYTCLGA